MNEPRTARQLVALVTQSRARLLKMSASPSAIVARRSERTFKSVGGRYVSASLCRIYVEPLPDCNSGTAILPPDRNGRSGFVAPLALLI